MAEEIAAPRWLAQAEREELEYLVRRLGLEADGFPLQRPKDGSGHWAEVVGERVARLQLHGATELHDLAGVGRFPGLRQLRLVGVRLETLHALEAPALRELRVARTPLVDLAALRGAPLLERLVLVDVPLTSLASLPPLRALREIALDRVALSDLVGLDEREALEALTLTRTGVTQLEGLGPLPRLRLLDVSRNALTTLAGLEGRRLAKIDASRNALADVGALLSTEGLEELDLRLNRIVDIPPALARRFPAAFDGNPGHADGVWKLHLADRAEERRESAGTAQAGDAPPREPR